MHELPSGGDSTPQCVCGATVTKRYVRVHAPPDLEAQNRVRACPNCDRQRSRLGGGVRDGRIESTRQGGDNAY